MYLEFFFVIFAFIMGYIGGMILFLFFLKHRKNKIYVKDKPSARPDEDIRTAAKEPAKKRDLGKFLETKGLNSWVEEINDKEKIPQIIKERQKREDKAYNFLKVRKKGAGTSVTHG